MSEPERVGLCYDCRHSRTIENARGNRFYLCELSRTDPRFARYPRLPVLRCSGYEPVDPEEAAEDG